MKMFTSLVLPYLQSRPSRRNLMILLRFIAVLVVMIGIYSVLFHVLMLREGQEFSWVTGVYWTLTVMSTLGFGDITFHTDVGRIFSIFVLLTGIVSLLVILPFAFIEFFYEPWMRAQAGARVRRTWRAKGHVVLTRYGPIASLLIDRLTRYHYSYVLVLPEVEEALQLHDAGFNVVVGDLDDPVTYERVNVEEAALVATTRSDAINTSVVVTVRELTSRVPIVATAEEHGAGEILKLAGCTRVLELSDMLAQGMARRTRAGETVAHVIGTIDELLIAEANAGETPFVNKSLSNSGIRDLADVTVVGLWERGRFEIARPETLIGPNAVLVLVGSRDQIAQFDKRCRSREASAAPVIIIGGGRVGRAVGEALARRSIPYRIIEQQPDLILDPETDVLGSASNRETLERAGIEEAPATIITTHNDETNIYVTISCRHLRPDMQIISRAKMERNVGTLHRVGSDFVLSDASIGANTIFNLLRRSDILMVAEGLDVFKVEVPQALVGKMIAESAIRRDTGCSIVAVDGENGTLINPGADTKLQSGTEIVMIGTVEGEKRFLEIYDS